MWRAPARDEFLGRVRREGAGGFLECFFHTLGSWGGHLCQVAKRREGRRGESWKRDMGLSGGMG